MFVVTVTFVVKAGDFAVFLPLMRENARQSLRQEPGCQRFDVCLDPDRSDTVFLYELYDNELAFEAHTNSPHFLAFSTATEDLIASKTVNMFTLLTDPE